MLSQCSQWLNQGCSNAYSAEYLRLGSLWIKWEIKSCASLETLDFSRSKLFLKNNITFLWVILRTLDDSESLIVIITFEWVFPGEHIEHHDTNTPHIAFLIIDIIKFRDFGGAIGCCTYKAPDTITINIRSCPEVYQLNFLLFVDKYILRLKVSMTYSMSVALFDGFKRLLNDMSDIPFSHGRSFTQPVESVHPIEELCD